MRYQANGYCPWLCCLTEWHWRSHRHARGPRRALERNEVHQPVHECAPACLPHAQRACSSERMHAPQLLCVCAQGCGPCAHAALCSLSCAHAWSCIINSHCVVLVSEHAKHEVLRTHEAHFNARTRFARVWITPFLWGSARALTAFMAVTLAETACLSCTLSSASTPPCPW